MKKLFAAALAAAMLFTSGAMADTTINPTAKRGITLQPVTVNETIEGISPTTGRTLSDISIPSGAVGLAATGIYNPMLAQIDNAEGGVGKRAPWNLAYADIIYETPLYLTHRSSHAIETRLSALFSDVLPGEAGPLRSARVGHASIREEWDCAFVRYGQQEFENTNVLDFFRDTGASKKGILYNGTDGAKAWTPYFFNRKGLASPHDKGANLAAMSTLIPENFVPANHTMLFTTDVPEGDAANEVYICWNMDGFNSHLVYNADANKYTRYMLDGNSKDTLYADYNTGDAIDFSNVIVQWIVCDWPNVAAPVPQMVGEGNADFFMGGVHVAGYWKRESMSSRTVFYGPDGNEISLQVGNTLISTLPVENAVSYK